MFEGLAALGLLNVVGNGIAVALIVWMLDAELFAPVWAKVPSNLKPLAVSAIYAGIVLASLYASCSGLQLDFGQTCQPDASFAQQAVDIIGIVLAYSVSGKLLFELVQMGK